VEESKMATVLVVYDEFGQILSIVPEGGDVPVARGGVQVMEASLTGEMEQLELDELARDFHVDVRTNALVEGPLEPPRQD
jgi:hypothetical protein